MDFCLHPPREFWDYSERSGITCSRLSIDVRALKQSRAGTLILSGGVFGPNGTRKAGVIGRLTAKLGVPKKRSMTGTESRNIMGYGINLLALVSQIRRSPWLTLVSLQGRSVILNCVFVDDLG